MPAHAPSSPLVQRAPLASPPSSAPRSPHLPSHAHDAGNRSSHWSHSILIFARNVRIFGSVARGDPTPNSDLDILVDMEEGRSLLDLVALWQDLQDLLGMRVDVISEGGMSPYLRAKILAEAVPL